MRVTINPSLDIATLTWVSDDGTYEYNGPVAELKVSKEAKANMRAQTAFYQQMTLQQTKMFAAQTDLLNQIKSVTLPILAKGPQQYGFTPEEDAMLRTAITDEGARATANVVGATQLRELQKTGGTQVLPTGASAELEQHARILGAQDTAGRLVAQKLAGFQAGNQLYAQALGALSGVAGFQDPTRYATAAEGAGAGATQAIQLADSQRSSLLGKILGGAATGVGMAICWVARAVYGEADPRWLLFRERFFDGRYPILARLYVRFGERFARLVRRSRWLRLVVKYFMDKVINATD